MAHHNAQLTYAPDAAVPAELPPPTMSRLRLVPGDAGRGVMDGGWWPRSRDAASELTELVTALIERLGMVTRVTVNFDDWGHVPLRITVLGQEIWVGWSPHLDHMVAMTCGRADPVLLLVVPPEASRSSAEAALARAAVEAGGAMPEEILASCDISTAPVFCSEFYFRNFGLLNLYRVG